MIPYENWHIGSTLPNPPTAKERRHGRLVLLLTAAVFLALAFGFAGCKTSQPDARHNATILPPPVGLDTTRQSATPQTSPSIKPGLLARIFHSDASKQDEKKTSNPAAFINPTAIPKKCKGCQFVTVIGNDNKVSQAHVDKNKAAAVIASDSSTLNSLSGGGNLQAVAGEGNTLTAANTEPQARDWKAELASPVGKVVAGVGGLVLVGALGYGLYLLLPFLKRRKSADPIA